MAGRLMTLSEEARAVKAALKRAGFEKVSVRKCTGTSAYVGFIDIRVASQFTRETDEGRTIRSYLTDAILEIAKRATGRTGDRARNFSVDIESKEGAR